MRGGNLIPLRDKTANSPNNPALVEFTQPEHDARLFSTWYSPETIKYLLHSSINASRCLRYVFWDGQDDVAAFTSQLECLITLANSLHRPALFISKEPGNPFHWVGGMVEKNNLFIFNPTGLTKHRTFYEALASLQKGSGSLLKKVVLSTAVLQCDPSGFVSCGPLCVEWAMEVSEQANVLETFLACFKQEADQEQEGLHYAVVDITPHLSGLLSTLNSSLSTEVYQEKLIRLRANHLEQLQSRSQIALEKDTSFSFDLTRYWENCLESPEQPLIFRLVHPDSNDRLHFLNIEESPLYQQLQSSLEIKLSVVFPKVSLIHEESAVPTVKSSALTSGLSLFSNQHESDLREFDVPADGTCLFYCVMFSVLLPLVRYAEVFREAFIYLFGEEVQDAAEQVREVLLGYDGSSHFITRNEAQLEVLVDIHFRKRIVDFMRAHKETFQDFYHEDEMFEERLAKIEKPKAWGDEGEIRAISLFLKRRIRVYQEREEPQDYGKAYDQRSAIHLVFVSASGQKGDAKNHYHFQLDKKYIPNLPKGHIDVGNESKKMFPTILSADHQTIQKNSPLKKAADEIEAARKNYNDYLKKAGDLLKEGSSSEILKEAEECCVKALKSANQLEGDEKQQALSIGFEVLGDIYSKRGCLFEKDLLKRHREKLKAVTLYNMALANEGQLLDVQKRLVQKIQQSENELLFSCGGIPRKENAETYWQEIQASRNILADIRNEARVALEEVNIGSPVIQTIYQKIAFGLREALVKKLINDCFELLPLPEGCVYSIMVLGSIAREEATPYSDFEWAILMEDQGEEKNQKHKDYFRRLTELVWIKVLNLRETTARMMDIESLSWFSENESPTKKGFSFDGQMMDGCHTPLGNKHHTEVKVATIQNNGSLTEQKKEQAIQKIREGEYELIGTPQELADFQQDKWESKRGFQTVLSTVDLIISNDGHLKEKSLLNVYQKHMENIWETPVRKEKEDSDDVSPQTLIQKRSLKFLAESNERFQFRGGRFDKEVHYFDAKYHLYRLPNMVIDHLASYFYFDGVKSKNLWDRIGEIFREDGKVPNPDGAENLKITVSRILALRLGVYLIKGYRDDHIVMFDVEHPGKNKLSLEKHLGVTQELLFDIFSVFIPLRWIMEKFVERNGLTQVLLKSTYYNSSPFFRGCIYDLLLDYANAIQSYKKARCNFITKCGTDNIYVASTLNNLGNVYNAQGKYNEAVEAYEEVKRIRIAVHGAEHILVADTLNNLGNVYDAQGKYTEAFEVYEEAKRIKIAVHGAGHISMAETLSNLGDVYYHQGKYTEAFEVYEEAKRIKIAVHGAGHISVANTLNNLGLVYGAQGSYAKELEVYEEAKRIKISVHGAGHISVAHTLNNLGNVYNAQGKYNEALEAYEEAKRIMVAVHGAGHILVADTLNNLGLVYADQGRYAEAIEVYEEAKRIMIAVRGAQHILVASTLNNLGNLYKAQGRYRDAVEAHEEVKRIRIAVHGGDHISVAESLNNVGFVYNAEGRYAEALKAYEEAKRITIAVHGAGHISVAKTLNNLGTVYDAQGRYAEAVEVYEEAKRIKIAVHGAGHISVAETLNNLGNVYFAQGRYAEAVEVYEEAKQIMTAVDAGHILMADTLNNLGLVYADQGRYAEAIEAYKESKRITIAVHGSGHISVAKTLNNLGVVYRVQGRYAEALEVYEEAKRIKIYVHGTKHISVASTLNNLGLVVIEQRRFSDARILFEQALDIYIQFDHPNKAIANGNLLISFLREGNLYLLQKEVDIQTAKICYQQFDPSFDPNDPDRHQSLANQFYESNRLSAIIEHYRILVRLKPDTVSVHHNLACLLHVCAQIEKDKGEKTCYQAYLKEVQGYFEEAIRLEAHTGVYAEYAQFMWKNRARYSLEFIIDTLQKSIDLGQIDEEFMYSLMERPILDENLQWLIDHEKEISFKAYFLAYYLLIQVYCADHQLKLAQTAYVKFQKEVTIFVENMLRKKNQIEIKISALIEAHPDQASKILQQEEQAKLQIEKECRLLRKLLDFSHESIDALKITLLSKQGEYEDLLNLLFVLSKFDVAYLPEGLLLNYIQTQNPGWNLETCRLHLHRLIESSDSLLVKLEEKEEGQTVYAISSVTQNVINGNFLIKPSFFLSPRYEKKQKASFKAAAELLSHHFNEKEMTQAIAFNANFQLLPHANALLSFFPDLSKEKDRELVHLLLPLFKTRCFMWLSMGDKRAQVPIEARGLRRALISHAKLNEKVDSVAIIYEKLASVHSDWSRHYAALLYILGRTQVHPVSKGTQAGVSHGFERGGIERTDYFEQCIDLCSVMEKQTGKSLDYRYLSKCSLLSLRCNDLNSLSVWGLERLLQEYEDLLSDSTVYWNEEGKALHFDTDLFNQRVCRRKLALICMELGARSSDTIIAGECFQKASNYLLFELKSETGSVVFELEAENYNTLAEIYYHQKNPHRDMVIAEKYFNEAYQMEFAKNEGKGKRDFPLADAAYGLARIALEQGHIQKSRYYAELCSSIRGEIGSSKLTEAERLLEDINSKQEASKNANASPSSLFAVANPEDNQGGTSLDDTAENRRETDVNQTMS